MILQRGRIFGLVLFKRRVTDQGVLSRDSLEQEQEMDSCSK